jgi:hypothetical protein
MSSEGREITRDDHEAVYVVLLALSQREPGFAQEPLHETIAFLYDEYATSDPPVPRDELIDEEAATRVVTHALLVAEAQLQGENQIDCRGVVSVERQCSAPCCTAPTFTAYCALHQFQRWLMRPLSSN